ncbi:unnamed protein product, partial [Mesorhabditis belari]|uniref:MARVEL domain-containing protein n=1 Tax=Mesorhabditis belari TaxID=2138241 RepID=A0AAF3EKX2_9BILA
MEIRCCFCCEDYRIVIEDEYSGTPGSEYTCCQGTVHIKTATMYVGISALILSAFSTICMFFGIYSVNLWLDIILIVVNTVVAILLLIGIYYEKAWMMIPFIITEIIQCVLFFSLASYTLYYMLKFKQDRFRRFDQILMVISIYVGIVICGSAIWAAAKCFHYLKDKEKNPSESRVQQDRRPTIDTSIHVECGMNGTGYWL